MQLKIVLLPLWAALSLYAVTVTAKSKTEVKPPKNAQLHFIENKGQITDQYYQERKDMHFRLSGGKGLNVFIGAGKIEYQWVKTTSNGLASPHSAALHGVRNEVLQEEERYELYRMDVTLIGANPYARILREDLQTYYEHYFLSWVNKANRNEGVIANAYSKITYKNIYPHIDWVLYGTADGHLEYDFIVHPGGKVSDIKIQYSGATSLALLPDGSLTAQSPLGSITENAPVSYEQKGNAIASSFSLNKDILSFKVADYTGTLVIDPVLEWGSYFGGAADEASNALTTDKWGHIYMAGSTSSMSNIATTGAYQITFGGGTNYMGADAFLSKWDIQGNLLWATYYGGTNVDVAKGVACDTAGNVYLGGFTNSGTGIATLGSYQELKLGTANRHDAFLVKFDTTGQRIWGTYFGGTLAEAHNSFALCADIQKGIYITGNTESTNLPVTTGAHQAANAGQDIFIAKFDVDCQLIWSTYYGGTYPDLSTALTADSNCNIYLTGYTKSPNGIATSGAHQVNINGNNDAFILKMDSSGSRLWATYFGGSENEMALAIALGGNKIYIGGSTQSSIGIATPNAHQNIFGGGVADGFLATFDLSGQLDWSSYYGGALSDFISGIQIDTSGAIYTSGETNSTDNIATADGIYPVNQGDYDVFLAKLDKSGKRLWCTYLGGTNGESLGLLTKDKNSNLYIAGITSSGNGISTNNAFQNSLLGGFDACLIKINDCPIPDKVSIIKGDTMICAGESTIYKVDIPSNAEYYKWIVPEGWEGISDSNSIRIVAGTKSDTLKVLAISSCGGISDTQYLVITLLPLPQPKIQDNNNILSTTKSYSNYQWLHNGTPISNAVQATYRATENGRYQVLVTNDYKCEGISDTMILDNILGIAEKKAGLSLNVYPNPVSDYCLIISNQYLTAQLVNIQGRIVLNHIRLQPGHNRLTLSEWPAGMYYLTTTDNQGNRFNLKLVKQ